MSPLPIDTAKTAWPPPSVPALAFAIWDEWYSGAFATNAEHATPPLTGGSMERLTGGFVHRHETQGSSASKAQPVHCPLAADIAQTSADLLFSDMPDVRFEGDKKSQKRLEELADLAGLQNELLEAAETCAALGGVYLRATWDKEVADYPFLTHVDADRAVPEFRYGRMQAVTFWREVKRDGQKVYRHLERHEKGVILHGLYYGDAATLGVPMPLRYLSETTGLEPVVTLAGGLSISAWYVPNARPNQSDRRSYLGRADIAGAEPFLDSLDEVWSGLMRDVRHGQTRIIVPHGTLEQNTAGQRGSGKRFDLDREVFTEIDVPPETPITTFQPEIRTEKYLTIATAKVREIVSKAGYSPQTFGLDIDGQAESGTALRIREEKTWRTLGRKRRYWEDELRKALTALLVIDSALFAGKAKPKGLPSIAWQEEATGLGEMSRIMLDLRNAESASIETRVRMVSPTKDDEWIAAEVERIRDESGSVVPEPAF